MKGIPKIKGIFGFSSTSNTMKSTGNENFSILIITSLIITTNFYDVLSTICNVIVNWRSTIFWTTINGIKLTLAPKSMSQFPTFISPIEIGNTTRPRFVSFCSGVCWITSKFSSCFISFCGGSSASWPLTITTFSSLSTMTEWQFSFGFGFVLALKAYFSWSANYFASWLICVSRFFIEVTLFFWLEIDIYINKVNIHILHLCWFFLWRCLSVVLIWFPIWRTNFRSPSLIVVPLEVIILILLRSLLVANIVDFTNWRAKSSRIITDTQLIE